MRSRPETEWEALGVPKIVLGCVDLLTGTKPSGIPVNNRCQVPEEVEVTKDGKWIHASTLNPHS